MTIPLPPARQAALAAAIKLLGDGAPRSSQEILAAICGDIPEPSPRVSELSILLLNRTKGRAPILEKVGPSTFRKRVHAQSSHWKPRPVESGGYLVGVVDGKTEAVRISSWETVTVGGVKFILAVAV